jgi:hypothetical protein
VASQAKQEGKRVASTAAQRGQQVAEATGQDAKVLVARTKEQAGQVAQQASTEAKELLDQTKGRVQGEAASQTQRLADRLASLGDEALALSEGRPEDAARARQFAAQAADKLFEAADKVSVVADDVEDRGFEGLLDDVQRFARRRPGLFLLGAAAAGFGIGRVVRAREPEPVEELDGPSRSAAAARAGNGSRRSVTAASTRRPTTGARGSVAPAPARRATAGAGGR